MGLSEIFKYAFFVIIALVLIIVIISIIKRNKNRIKVDDSFIDNLILILGGIDNINMCEVENMRVKFKLADLNKADLKQLHQLSPKGVFVTGDVVKALFSYDSETIIKMLNKKLRQGEV